ncbi:tripartite tricarboxylate transporter TctB family protein [Micromonospora sp. WMMD558]|uniref:tripartite tricarboxylate transporter TctB family protein n=1 Tax=Micromonospora sp. WMMD558 TaxID=3403462 RepID=UPI003BF4E1F4
MSRLAAGVAAASGIAMMVVAAGLSLTTADGPGPGLWPFTAATLVTVCGVVAMLRPAQEEYEPAEPGGIRRVLLGSASLVVFVVAFTWVGFVIAGTVTFWFWLKVLGGGPWLTSTLLAPACVVGIQLLFVVGLGVPFPPDPIADLWS